MKYCLLLTCIAITTACTSPEATRSRGSGAGADVGNRNDPVLMHEGSNPYQDTPRLLRTEPAPLDAATHADRLSRES